MKAVRCSGLGDSSAKLRGASGRGEAGGKAARADHTDPDAEQFLLYFKHVRPEFAGRPPRPELGREYRCRQRPLWGDGETLLGTAIRPRPREGEELA